MVRSGSCLRERHKTPHMLANICGWDARLTDVARRMRCSTCRAEACSARAVPVTVPRGVQEPLNCPRLRIRQDSRGPIVMYAPRTHGRAMPTYPTTFIPCPRCRSRVQASVLAEREYPGDMDNIMTKNVFVEYSQCTTVMVGLATSLRVGRGTPERAQHWRTCWGRHRLVSNRK
jgi:hypothetical protein